jgi:hypothetical protein
MAAAVVKHVAEKELFGAAELVATNGSNKLVVSSCPLHSGDRFTHLEGIDYPLPGSGDFLATHDTFLMSICRKLKYVGGFCRRVALRSSSAGCDVSLLDDFARMRLRIILILAVAIMIRPSLAYGSPFCMTINNCWNVSATVPAHSPRRALAAVPVPTPRPVVTAEPVRFSQPVVAESVPSPQPAPAAEPSPGPVVSDDVTAVQCRYSPCE